MSIEVGGSSIGEVYAGSDAISEIYKGNDLVWSAYAPEINYIFRNIDSNGKLTLATGALEDASEITKIGYYGLAYGFYRNTSITGSVLFSELTSVGYCGFFFCFYDNDTGIKKISFPKLTDVGYEAFAYCFEGCRSLTSVSFPKLTNMILGDKCMRRCFAFATSLTSISFPALTPNSFGSYTNQFKDMLYKVTGCTVHFPSNLQSVIGSWSDVTAGFGGTNTTILYDLPATS